MDKNNNSIIGSIFGIVAVGVLIWFIVNLFQSKSWTLFVYSTESPDTEYLLDRVNDIETKDACILVGQSYTTKGGSYECALNCKYKQEYGMEICEKTCDHGGCRD